MFSKTLSLAQIFTAVNIMLYSVAFGIEFEQKNYGKVTVSAVLAILHLLVLIHLLLAENESKKGKL